MLKNFKVWATIPVADLDRAVKFYEGSLGLKVNFVNKDMMVAVVEAGGGTLIQLYQRGPSKADHTLATFEVENMEPVIAGLRAAGVGIIDYDTPEFKTVNGIATVGNEKACWFNDSEGNILCLHETIK